MTIANLHAVSFYERLGVSPTATREEVRRAYRALVKKYSPERNPEEFKRLREAYETLGDDASRAEYDQQEDPLISEALEEGRAALQAERYNEAERAFKRVLVLSPELHYVRNLLGLTFLYKDEPARALEQFQKILAEGNPPATCIANAGHALRQLKRYEEAQKAFIDAAGKSEDRASEYFSYFIDVLLEAGQLEKADAALEQAIAADGVVNVDDIGHFTRLIAVKWRMGDSKALHALLNRIARIPEDDRERQFVALELAKVSRDMLAGQVYFWSEQVAKVAERLDPSDADYFALRETAALLRHGKVAVARDMLTRHRSFRTERWLQGVRRKLQGLTDAQLLALASSPVDEPPSLRTINGFGQRLMFDSAPDKDGCVVTTLCWTALFLPVLPIASYRVLRREDGRVLFLERVPMPPGMQSFRRVLLGVYLILALVYAYGMWFGASGSASAAGETETVTQPSATAALTSPRPESAGAPPTGKMMASEVAQPSTSFAQSETATFIANERTERLAIEAERRALESAESELKRERSRLEQESEVLDDERTRIDAINAGGALNEADNYRFQGMINRYNATLDLHRAAVRRHRRAFSDYQFRLDVFNARVDAYNARYARP